jgi:precorrin-6A synthase
MALWLKGAGMIDLHLIGIGTGNPDHLTRAAIRALNTADLLLVPHKGDDKADLADLRHMICAQVLERDLPIVGFDLPTRATDRPYLDAVSDWHDAIAACWRATIAAHLPQGGHVGLMVWGDPSLYDSSLRIAARLQAAGLPMRIHVVPGITSLQVLTAAHGIALNRLAGPVTITTGRRLREAGWPAGAERVAVMLDKGGAFEVLEGDEYFIWWGAYLGMAEQILISGPLHEMAGEIVARRAKARAAHGWIMDIYLIERRCAP